jgi:hypothetical protein
MNEFPLFCGYIAIKIGRTVVESSDVILPRSGTRDFHLTPKWLGKQVKL